MYSLFIPTVIWFVGVLLILRHATRRSRHRLPPGPPGLPFIGNALQMPVDREWLKFTDWAKTYGNVVHLSVIGRPIIVLSSRDAIFDLLEKKSGIYSDRPVAIVAGEMMGYNRYITMEPHGHRHREGRKLILKSLSTRNAPALQHVQEAKVVQLLSKLLGTPADFRLHVRWLVASIVFHITHGHHVEDFDDPIVKIAEKATEEFSMAVRPGTYLVESLPFLRHLPDWVPGTSFKAFAKQGRKTLVLLGAMTYGRVKKEVAQGTAVPSITASLIEGNSNPTSGEEDLWQTTTSTFYGAAADTTVSAIVSFFLMMTLYPDVQRKAQAELDSVIEAGRLPRFSDREKLPYVEALIKEAYRWNPVLPLALPHKATQNDVYEGYHIPAGTTIIANTWAVLHDPSLYPSPFEVMPERYFTEDGDLNPDPRAFSFGYGRRVCPGQLLAEDMLFIVVASVLSSLNISKAVDSNGLSVEPEVSYTGGALSHASPFECCIKARSIESERLVAAAAA